MFAAALRRRTGVPQPVGRLLGRWTLLLRQWRDTAAAAAAFQVPCLSCDRPRPSLRCP